MNKLNSMEKNKKHVEEAEAVATLFKRIKSLEEVVYANVKPDIKEVKELLSQMSTKTKEDDWEIARDILRKETRQSLKTFEEQFQKELSVLRLKEVRCDCA